MEVLLLDDFFLILALFFMEEDFPALHESKVKMNEIQMMRASRMYAVRLKTNILQKPKLPCVHFRPGSVVSYNFKNPNLSQINHVLEYFVCVL